MEEIEMSVGESTNLRKTPRRVAWDCSSPRDASSSSSAIAGLAATGPVLPRLLRPSTDAPLVAEEIDAPQMSAAAMAANEAARQAEATAQRSAQRAMCIRAEGHEAVVRAEGAAKAAKEAARVQAAAVEAGEASRWQRLREQREQRLRREAETAGGDAVDIFDRVMEQASHKRSVAPVSVCAHVGPHGLGLVLDENNVILDLVEGGQAATDGLLVVGDELISVDGEVLHRRPLAHVLPPGKTEYTFTVRRPAPADAARAASPAPPVERTKRELRLRREAESGVAEATAFFGGDEAEVPSARRRWRSAAGRILASGDDDNAAGTDGGNAAGNASDMRAVSESAREDGELVADSDTAISSSADRASMPKDEKHEPGGEEDHRGDGGGDEHGEDENGGGKSLARQRLLRAGRLVQAARRIEAPPPPPPPQLSSRMTELAQPMQSSPAFLGRRAREAAKEAMAAATAKAEEAKEKARREKTRAAAKLAAASAAAAAAETQAAQARALVALSLQAAHRGKKTRQALKEAHGAAITLQLATRRKSRRQVAKMVSPLFVTPEDVGAAVSTCGGAAADACSAAADACSALLPSFAWPSASQPEANKKVKKKKKKKKKQESED